MRRMWATGAAILACLALHRIAPASAATPLDFNISVNSGAEAGRGGAGQVVPIPMWRTTGTMTAVRYGTPGFPTRAQARAVNGEANVFYCGGGSSAATARQRIALRGRSRLIDAGSLSLELTVRIGSTTKDGDSGTLIVRYLGADGSLAGALQTETVVPGRGVLPRYKATGGVPAGTRSLLVILEGTPAAGTGCDMLFDNVSVRLVRHSG